MISSPDEAMLERAVAGVAGIPASSGNEVHVLRNGEEIFPAMLDAIERAERTVDLLTYVYWSGQIADRFADTLAARARDGVRVRVLLDAVGAKTSDPAAITRMRDAGADVRWFRPLDPRHPIRAANRTHRKVMVCDETVGFTGGVGIADEWTGDGRHDGQWRDTHFRVSGPVVAGLASAFVENWFETGHDLVDPSVDRWTGQTTRGETDALVVKGTSGPGDNTIALLVRAAVDLSRERVRLTTAYFVPDDDLVDRINSAAERGVDVALLVPGPEMDKRFVQLAGETHFRALMEAGVRVVTYQPSMLHAKVLTFDGRMAIVGSANLNHRSISHDEEVALVVFDRQVTEQLDADFDADCAYGEELDLRRWRRRSWWQRTTEGVSELLSPWM